MNIKPIRLFNIYGEDKGTGFAGNVWDINTVSPTLTTMGGGNRQPLILTKGGNTEVNVAIKSDEKYVENISDDFEFVKRRTSEMLEERGELPKKFNPYNKSEIKDISPTIITNSNSSSSSGQVLMKQENYRIRKLTPKECWRLMGFDDSDFEKAEKVCSNTQLYKQAGNSIVVNVLEGILGNLLPKPSRSEWLDELLGG